jgi:hypothetical protein
MLHLSEVEPILFPTGFDLLQLAPKYRHLL